MKVKWDRAPQRTKRRNRPRAHLGHSRDVFSLFHGKHHVGSVWKVRRTRDPGAGAPETYVCLVMGMARSP